MHVALYDECNYITIYRSKKAKLHLDESYDESQWSFESAALQRLIAKDQRSSDCIMLYPDLSQISTFLALHHHSDYSEPRQ